MRRTNKTAEMIHALANLAGDALLGMDPGGSWRGAIACPTDDAARSAQIRLTSQFRTDAEGDLMGLSRAGCRPGKIRVWRRDGDKRVNITVTADA